MTRNYDDPVYARARKNVLKRDGRKCQMPKCKNRRKLQVHHIIPWSQASILRFEEYNMITLCRSCHESIKDREHLYISLFNNIVNKKIK